MAISNMTISNMQICILNVIVQQQDRTYVRVLLDGYLNGQSVCHSPEIVEEEPPTWNYCCVLDNNAEWHRLNKPTLLHFKVFNDNLLLCGEHEPEDALNCSADDKLGEAWLPADATGSHTLDIGVGSRLTVELNVPESRVDWVTRVLHLRLDDPIFGVVVFPIFLWTCSIVLPEALKWCKSRLRRAPDDDRPWTEKRRARVARRLASVKSYRFGEAHEQRSTRTYWF